MAAARRPPKHENLLELVRQHVEEGTYVDTRHATERQTERAITRPEVLFVLKNGYHEKSKDKFEGRYGAWTYAIRGKTIDGRALRVCVTFDTETGMLIVTAIDLDV